MTDTHTCTDPHPARGEQWPALHPDLERLDGHGDDDWARCVRCGTWLWLTTETSKHMHAEHWVLDRTLAERALIARDPVAIIDLLAGYGLPNGPMWTSANAVIGLLRHLSSGGAPAMAERIDEYLDGSRAYGRPDHASRWQQVRDRLLASERAAHAPHRPLRSHAPLSFAVDIEADFSDISEALEIPGGAIMLRESPPAVLRWSAGALTHIPMAAEPEFGTHTDAGVVVHVNADGQHALVLFHAEGQSVAQVPGPVLVRGIARNHWLLWPEVGGERRRAVVCDAHLTGVGEVELAYPYAPVAWGDGWIAVAPDRIAVLDARLTPVYAASTPCPPASLHVVDDLGVLAHTTGPESSLSMWRPSSSGVERAWDVPCWTYARLGARIVLLTRTGDVLALDLDGTELWRRPHGGANHVQRAGDAVYLAGATGVHLLDPSTGAVTTTIPTSHLGRTDRNGTTYFAADEAVWTLRGNTLARHGLGTFVAVVTTVADAAVVHEPATDDYALVGSDGAVRGWFATDHPLPISGTRAGPYVVEPARLRIGCVSS